MSVVCIDTQILYWAVVGKAAIGATKLIKPARDFMKWLEEKNHHIIIPSIVVGEMLVPVQEINVPTMLARFNEDWMVVDYDMRAARHFAQMRRDHATKKRFIDIRDLHPDITKKELVADVMIIATAIAHSADILYSHNEDLLKLADGWIVAKNFMDEQFQLSLPEEDDND
jgi:predicted nucleic acid-binding protein